jgi:hypothetical protein
MRQERTTVNVTITDSDNPPTLFPYGLEQNYPNPFNPITNIGYSLAAKGHVSITAYSVDGKKVRILVNKVQEPGRYDISWNGKDDINKALSSGLYFIRYDINGHRFTQKAVLLR